MTRPGEVQVGRRIPANGTHGGLGPVRQMTAHDRIRLTGLLRKSPAPAGLF